MLLADDLMTGTPAIIGQMVEQYNERSGSILAVQDVPREHTNRYGVVSGEEVKPGLVDVTGIVEKLRRKWHLALSPLLVAIF